MYYDTDERAQLIQNFYTKHAKDNNDKEKLKYFLDFQKNELFKAKAALKSFYDKIPTSDPNELTNLFQVALKSGHKIYLKFQEYR